MQRADVKRECTPSLSLSWHNLQKALNYLRHKTRRPWNVDQSSIKKAEERWKQAKLESVTPVSQCPLFLSSKETLISQISQLPDRHQRIPNRWREKVTLPFPHPRFPFELLPSPANLQKNNFFGVAALEDPVKCGRIHGSFSRSTLEPKSKPNPDPLQMKGKMLAADQRPFLVLELGAPNRHWLWNERKPFPNWNQFLLLPKTKEVGSRPSRKGCVAVSYLWTTGEHEAGLALRVGSQFGLFSFFTLNIASSLCPSSQNACTELAEPTNVLAPGHGEGGIVPPPHLACRNPLALPPGIAAHQLSIKNAPKPQTAGSGANPFCKARTEYADPKTKIVCRWMKQSPKSCSASWGFVWLNAEEARLAKAKRKRRLKSAGLHLAAISSPGSGSCTMNICAIPKVGNSRDSAFPISAAAGQGTWNPGHFLHGCRADLKR